MQIGMLNLLIEKSILIVSVENIQLTKDSETLR